MIAVSGNHDYRNTGYLLFRKYFSSPSVSDLGEGVMLATIGTARPDRNEGEVGYRQNLWLENTLRKYKDRLILVAMHHHLMDVPDTGSDHQTVRDAGDVLRTILDSGVKLVLCGHNHRPWVWDFGKLKVINAGTATSERPRGLFENTYNIITIRNGEAEVDLKIVGGRRMPLSDIVRDYSRSDSSEPADPERQEAAVRRLLIRFFLRRWNDLAYCRARVPCGALRRRNPFCSAGGITSRHHRFEPRHLQGLERLKI